MPLVGFAKKARNWGTLTFSIDFFALSENLCIFASSIEAAHKPFKQCQQMKKLFFFAISALVMLGCNTKSSASSQSDEKKESREVKTKVFDYESNDDKVLVKLSIEMPVDGDKELGDNIYVFILEELTRNHDCSDDLDVYRNDGQGLVDLFGKWKSDELHEDWSYYTEDIGQEVVFTDSVSFSIVEDNDKYLTYLCESRSFNGADGYWTKTGVTFLKSDCSRVTNDFLFKDPYSQELVTLLRDDVIEDYCGGKYGDWDEPDVETVESVLDIPFYLTPEGLAYFYRRPLVLLQNVDGMLPWDKVKGLLTDEAKKLLD